MFEIVLMDLDETIFDFKKAEKNALYKTLEKLGITPNDELSELYSRINLEHWKMLERGEINRWQVKVLRFDAFFKEIGENIEGERAWSIYEKELSKGGYVIEGAESMLQKLFGKCRLFIVSNGTKSVQDSRIEISGIGKYFEDIFISEDLGYNKPDKRFFDEAFKRIEGFDPERDLGKVIIVGDSPTSDIKGGINAGIKTCMFIGKSAADSGNHKKDDSNDGTESDNIGLMRPDYVAKTYEDIEKIVLT